MAPIYDYECPKGHKHSVTQSITDYKPGDVPCKAKRCREMAIRVIAPTATTFHHNDRKAIKRKGH